MPTTHELFLGKLDGSDRPVFFAARWFRLRKRYVTLPPINRAPTREDAPLYSDDWDLKTLHNGIEQFYSVKGTSRTFVGDPTVKGGWPFKCIFIDKVKNVDETGDHIHAYITVSADFSTMCVVQAKSRPTWWQELTTDELTGKEYLCYAAPLSEGRWWSMADPITKDEPKFEKWPGDPDDAYEPDQEQLL